MRIAVLLLSVPALWAQDSLNVTTGLRSMVDDYFSAIALKHFKQRDVEIAAIRTQEDVVRRQAYIRQKILASIGGFPEKTPLNVRITGTLERDGYRVEKLVYESLPGFHVTANVYVPTRGRAPYPAVLGVAGHTANGKASATYQRAWIGMVKRGMIVLAFDPPGQGERTQYYDPEIGRSLVGGSTTEHTMAGLQCLLTGSNFARYESWDGIRGVDYLLTRSDVDAKRLAVAGNSGGGTQSAYLAVLEPRLAAAAPSCYLTSWQQLWFKPGPQDAEQNFAGFLSDHLDFGDFLIAFAPRPISMQTAIRDFFPIDGARNTYAEARRIFDVMGAADRVGYFEYDDTHGWSKPRREATYRWFERWLNRRNDEGIEPEFDTEPESLLYASPTGQVATSFRSQTVQSLNRIQAEKLHAERTARSADGPGLRAIVAQRLGFVAPLAASRISRRGDVGRDGYRIEKLVLETEPGIQVPALVFLPAAGSSPKPAVLYLHSGGKTVDAAPGGDIEALVRTGRIVMAIDPRGWGESAGGGRSSYTIAMRAILLGKTLVGLQLTDALSAFNYLASRPGVDPARVSVLGKRNGGILALLAAATEPRIDRVAVERSVVSYLAIARARQHEGLADIIVPGVLLDFDLPDLARAIAPRRLWIVDPRTPTDAAIPLETAAADYRQATVVERPEARAFERVYADWLR
jgi:cephalosporin-C deacetylase-like acetyl esterase